MRGAAPALRTPYPIGEMMPALFQEDSFVMRWTDGIDAVLSVVIATIDSLLSYVDPLITPPDFLLWLAGWFDTSLDENWPLERQRRAVAESVRLYRMRGTVAGLKEQLELFTDGVVDIADSGGVTTSPTPTPWPTEPSPPWVSIRVRVADPKSLSVPTLEGLVRAARPAHVLHALEVIAL
jgi:phage tail-like protein